MPAYIKVPSNPDIVDAEQLQPGAQASPAGARKPRVGDWIITYADLHQEVLTEDEFRRSYMPYWETVEEPLTASDITTPPEPELTVDGPVAPDAGGSNVQLQQPEAPVDETIPFSEPVGLGTYPPGSEERPNTDPTEGNPDHETTGPDTMQQPASTGESTPPQPAKYDETPFA